MREKLSLSSGLMEALIVMAEGNPGAVSVLAQLAKDPAGFIDILHLDDMGMRGPQIWIGYKDHCKQDLEAFRKAIRDRDPAMIATVNASMGTAPGTPPAVTAGASFR